MRRLARPGAVLLHGCIALHPHAADPDPDGGAVRRSIALPIVGIALVVFNWPYPARQVRAVALTMREREFVNVAWFSGESSVRILVRQILPYIAGWSAANFINTVLVGISTESALAVIGLSSAQQATLGTMIYWAIKYQALLAGQICLDWLRRSSRSCCCSSASSWFRRGCPCAPAARRMGI